MRAGVDFSTYRPATVERRIRSRMISLGMTCFADYLALLRSCRDEPLRLIERITIKVSRFYRHAPAFDCLREKVLPELARQQGVAPLRIWSLGTGAGEEAYTLAMLLHEAKVPGSIEACDIDPAACEAGRLGIYPSSALAELPKPLADRYLDPVTVTRHAQFRVCDELRPLVRFSIYDATRPGPPPGEGCFDLIVCRNLLIYLRPSMQARVLRHLRCALGEQGFLFLGEAEWPGPDMAHAFEPLPHRTRLFRARPSRAAVLQ